MKKFLPSLMVTAFALAAGTSIVALKAQAQGSTKTVWGGVFSADQAATGKTLFDSKCAICHGADLNGGEMSPPLAGGAFVANWSGQTLGDLFTRIHTTMPANDPGSLNNAETAQVLAYILSFNQFPTGSAPLPDDEASLGQIGITDKK